MGNFEKLSRLVSSQLTKLACLIITLFLTQQHFVKSYLSVDQRLSHATNPSLNTLTG